MDGLGLIEKICSSMFDKVFILTFGAVEQKLNGTLSINEYKLITRQKNGVA